MLQTRGLQTTLVGLGAILTVALGFISTARAQTQLTEHTASDAAPGDNFGHSVGLSGDYAVAGAHLANSPESNRGAAYVFHWDGVAWSETAKLTSSNGADGDFFGYAVAISGDVIVVGAPEHGANGAAYVFRRNAGGWVEEAILSNAACDRFGDAVAIEGDRIAVGDSQAAGKAFIFQRIASVWTQQADLAALASPLLTTDQFGYSVSISGDSVAVGARNDSALASLAGATYVFHYNAGSWSLQATIRPAPVDANANDQFGSAVSIDGNALAIGAPGDDDPFGDSGAITNIGATYVFNRSGSSWSQTTKLAGFLHADGDAEGWSVALDGTRLASGAYQRGGSYGAVHIYQYNGAIWEEDDGSPVDDFDFNPDITEFGDELGTSVAIDDDLILAGIPGKDIVPTESGSMLFFEAFGAGDPDGDYDGFPDNIDNCPTTFNDQANFDGDEQGDACDADDDNDGLLDVDEALHTTNPLNPDTDGDGLNDGPEVTHSTDPTDDDSDDDTLLDGMEISLLTNPNATDTDGDGLGDAVEAPAGCPHPTVADSDGDGLLDGFENTSGWDPCDADTDGDLLSDSAEFNIHGTDPNDPDTDSDNLQDGAEVALAVTQTCVSPLDADSDNDGILDGDEVTAGAGPCDIDSDDDGLADGLEAGHGTSIVDPDSDDDGLLDGAEVETGCTNPLATDTDGDTLSDGAEATAGTNPCNPDTDGDTLPDNTDPNPLLFSATVLASLTLATAGEVLDTPVGEFLGPNGNVRTVRRTILTAQISLAAAAINNGNYNAARALLALAISRVDGVNPPPDWMHFDSEDRECIHADLESLVILLDMIS